MAHDMSPSPQQTDGRPMGILGSKPACGSPRLIAASYALRRLLMPGHSPYTLSSLTITLALLLTHMVLLGPIQLSKNERGDMPRSF